MFQDNINKLNNSIFLNYNIYKPKHQLIMEKVMKVKHGKYSIDMTVSPDSMIDGQLIRSGAVRLLSPAKFVEIFEIKPEQVYLDKTLTKIAQYSDDHLFELWIEITYIEENKSNDPYEVQMYALEDIVWGLFLIEYHGDHPESWDIDFSKFDKRKKNWFEWY